MLGCADRAGGWHRLTKGGSLLTNGRHRVSAGLSGHSVVLVAQCSFLSAIPLFLVLVIKKSGINE